jgi:hypothetical protein
MIQLKKYAFKNTPSSLQHSLIQLFTNPLPPSLTDHPIIDYWVDDILPYY